MSKIFIVTYCSPYAEYNNQIYILKGFNEREAAEEFIEVEKHEEANKNDDLTGNYEIKEVEVV